MATRPRSDTGQPSEASLLIVPPRSWEGNDPAADRHWWSSWQVLCNQWTVAYQSLLSIGFSRQEFSSGLPVPSPGDPPDPGMEPLSLTSPAVGGGFFTTSEHHLKISLLTICMFVCFMFCFVLVSYLFRAFTYFSLQESLSFSYWSLITLYILRILTVLWYKL